MYFIVHVYALEMIISKKSITGVSFLNHRTAEKKYVQLPGSIQVLVMPHVLW